LCRLSSPPRKATLQRRPTARSPAPRP
jgi:hypothetical protein